MIRKQPRLVSIKLTQKPGFHEKGRFRKNVLPTTKGGKFINSTLLLIISYFLYLIDYLLDLIDSISLLLSLLLSLLSINSLLLRLLLSLLPIAYCLVVCVCVCV